MQSLADTYAKTLVWFAAPDRIRLARIVDLLLHHSLRWSKPRSQLLGQTQATALLLLEKILMPLDREGAGVLDPTVWAVVLRQVHKHDTDLHSCRLPRVTTTTALSTD